MLRAFAGFNHRKIRKNPRYLNFWNFAIGNLLFVQSRLVCGAVPAKRGCMRRGIHIPLVNRSFNFIAFLCRDSWGYMAGAAGMETKWESSVEQLEPSVCRPKLNRTLDVNLTYHEQSPQNGKYCADHFMDFVPSVLSVHTTSCSNSYHNYCPANLLLSYLSASHAPPNRTGTRRS
jgi:hypothetical protein